MGYAIGTFFAESLRHNLHGIWEAGNSADLKLAVDVWLPAGGRPRGRVLRVPGARAKCCMHVLQK